MRVYVTHRPSPATFVNAVVLVFFANHFLTELFHFTNRHDLGFSMECDLEFIFDRKTILTHKDY